MADTRPDWGSDEAGEALLRYLRRPDYRPATQRQLLHLLHVGPDERPLVRRLIRRLLREGRIERRGGGKLSAASARRGERGAKTRREGARGGERPRDRTIVAVYRQLDGRKGEARPLDPGDGERLEVPGAFRHAATDGDVVGVRVVPMSRRDGGRPAAKVVEVLGRLDDPATAITAIARKYGLRERMPPEIEAAAEELPRRVPRREAGRRTRFDDPAPVTIDGATAKDFDDAVAVAELPGGGFRLWVHIADVSHFVAPGDALDDEARERGTSVYFPSCVLPMFPERLSNDLCSLRPRVERLVQSVVLDIGPRGGVKRARFADGLIRSAARLTYDQVAEVLDGAERVHGVPADVVPMLRTAGRLAALLARTRARRGSLDFDLPEPEILLDVEGAITGIEVRERNVAHRLIEEFMIAANEAVARELEHRDAPCVFRIHERPDPDKIEALADFVAAFGETLRHEGGEVEPRHLRRLLGRLAGRPEGAVANHVALRAMKQARYSTVNEGHFGLASTSYAHFTSPIRRYPDLLVHRALRALRRGAAPPHDAPALERMAGSCTELERGAESAEREILAWRKVEYIARHVGETFDAVVTGVTAFGLFVQLTANLVEGLIHVTRLGPERWTHDESRHALVGERSGIAFRLGDRLRVRVDRVDTVLHRADMVLAGEDGDEDGGADDRRRGRSRGERRRGADGRRERRGGRRRRRR